ncbi:MAG: tRNA (adenosine(37)-N6)-threonylcarbamoyltransferase complex transferase subunit TsaD [bacterium]|nr:tRNA (adenosine(37)-N6)-threonylcarbamoyltransferase complex transferase subunit TsaD [bacterium]
MKILAIETSCDETAMALVDCKGNPLLKNRSAGWRIKVLENIVSSQIAIHRPFGGVVPNLAKREHIKNLPKIYQSLVASHKSLKFDLIAVTVGPGLEPALWAGIEFAKSLAKETGKPLVGGNHMEGHLFSNWLPHSVIASAAKQSNKNLSKIATTPSWSRNDKIKFPAIALVVSGGHTMVIKMDSLKKWKNLGETRDDAAGEAFDKVARLLGLQYPGGPEVERLAKNGNPKAVNFPRPMLNPPAGGKNYEFSFSGLKTSVLYYLRDHPFVVSRQSLVADVAASFQQAVIDTLVGKTMRAAEEFGAQSVLLSGGVAANKRLREIMKLETEKLGREFFVPDFQYNTDNAVMIAAAAYIAKLRGKKYPMRANSNLSL